VNREAILATVEKYLVDAVEGLTPGEIDARLSMKALGASSLDIVEVVSRTMRELRIKIPRSELSTLENVDQLVDLLHQAAQSQGRGPSD